ncbi:hypothetical protein ABZP36_005973 [Zizania latifolia]
MRCPLSVSPRRRRLTVVVLFFALSSISGSYSQRLVTLDTIDIFTNNELLPSSIPTVYFQCNGEDKVYLPDVKEANIVYTFKGKESWQPLTELPENKCKQCGLYEEDIADSDDMYDAWELCSTDFKDGKCTHFKQGEFRATFLCPNCTASSSSASNSSASAGDSANHHPDSEVKTKKTSVTMIIVVSVVASIIVIIALFGAYKYCQKKREKDRAPSANLGLHRHPHHGN